jgi:hypothetical protein
VPTSSGAVGTAEGAPCHIRNASAAFATLRLRREPRMAINKSLP